MYHPRLKGNHYDMGRYYGELLAKSAFRTETRLAWGMNKAKRK